MKLASMERTKALAEMIPNWRMGGRPDRARARKPPALMKVAKTIARPAISRACRSASSVVPELRFSWKWKKK